MKPKSFAQRTAGSPLRLSGEVAGAPHSFPLDRDEMTIGSSRSCQIRLRDKGISRRHAVLRRDSEGWWLEDLESKNGTFVNGEAIERQQVSEGDRLQFASLEMVLDAIDPEDGELGLELDLTQDSISPTLGLTLTQSDSLLREGGPLDEAGLLRLLGASLEHLTQAGSSPDSALDLLVRELGADAAALLEWHRDRAPVLLAQSGPIGDLPKSSDIWSTPTGDDGRVAPWIDAPPWPIGGLIGRNDHEIVGLFLWGDFPRRRDCPPLLTLMARLFMAFEQRPLADLGARARREKKSPLLFPPGIVPGESRPMTLLYERMTPLLSSDVPVLIRGETGVGKEHLARTLHASSPRSERPFVALNCAAIPGELLEAELFGVGKGVATGVDPRKGKFAEAEGGTLFLDEIGDMPAALQAKLLRALQEKEIRPLGEQPRQIDVRVVAATNTDIALRMKEGRFREDLYYRIAGFVLEVPALRVRRGDLPRLVGHFTRRACSEAGKRIRGFTVKALRLLDDYAWPGNVRQLEHEIRRLVYLCPTDQAVDSSMISPEIVDGATRVTPAPDTETESVSGIDDSGEETLDLETHVQALERRLIRRALHRARGNQSKAAKLLGLSRNGLANRLKRLELDIYDSASGGG